MFIDVNEYQTKILNIIGSDELDKIIASSVYADNHELRMAIIYGMTIASMYTTQCTQYTFDVTKSDASDIGELNMKTHMVDIDTNTDVYDAIIHTSSHANISEGKDDSKEHNKKHDQGCEKCIYIDNCPCGWSKNNAACLIIRQIDEE